MYRGILINICFFISTNDKRKPFYQKLTEIFSRDKYILLGSAVEVHLLLKDSADIEAIIKGIFHAHLLRRKLNGSLLQQDDQDEVFIEKVIKSQAEMTQGSHEKGKLIIDIVYDLIVFLPCW